MGADANIFQQYLQQPKSVLDYQAAYDQADARKNALAQSVQALQKGQMDLSNAADVNRQRNALRDAVTSGQVDLSNPDHVSRILSISPDVAPAMLKTVQEGATSRALASKDTAQAGEAVAKTTASQLDQVIKAHDFQIQKLGAVNDPQSAKQWAIDGLKSGVFTPEQFAQGFNNIPADPAQFAAWKQQAMQGGTSATEQLKMQQAKLIADNINKTHIQTTGMTNATSRANNKDTIAAENLRAGVTPGGGMDDNSERTAQAIANGQLPAPTGMALLNPKNQRILGRVMEINPQYDATTVSAKKAAATAFTSGQLGNALRSVSTANAHLDQLGELADALDNGNVQVVNKVQNYFSQQTGSPNVTNFDAIKNIVGQEVVKAIVAGGGGVQEREEAAKVFSSASSPAQLKGAIQHYRMVMGAQANNLMEQRRAAGLPDSTLPNYSATNPKAAPAAAPAGLPSGWTVKVN